MQALPAYPCSYKSVGIGIHALSIEVIGSCERSVVQSQPVVFGAWERHKGAAPQWLST